MLFSSIPFLYYFLPLVLAVYFLTPRAGKNAVLFLSSLLFYAWGEPKFCIFMLLSILQGYVFGRLIEKHAQNKKRSKLFLTASVALSLALLAYCKYADFFLSSVNAVTGLSFKLLHVTLPIGISFYTFQILSYVVDVYRGSVPAQKSFLKLGTYIAMFPQLIAGPIVRYAEIAPQLDSRQTTLEDVSSGACRFVIGLSKKVLLANVLYELITAFQQSRDLSVLYFWLYAVSFALQLYFDFSGYSDMAIGLGRIFGFRFQENFNYPYISGSITEFWRRWHISLGSWFKEYLYFPLGGSRTGTLRTLRNLLLVWLATGLWHGASWNYVLWGLYFGVLICLEKLLAPHFRAHPRKGLLAGLYRPVCLLLAVLGWVLFRAEDLPAAGRYFACLFGGAAGVSAQARLYLHDFWPVLLLGAVGATPLCAKLAGRLGAKLRPGVRAAVQAVLVLALLACSTVWLLNGSFQSFVYFQF